MPKLKTVQCLDIPEPENQSTSPLNTFLTRYPTRFDADHNGYVFAYKPKGWPELLQPQYRHAPAHILAQQGYWSRMHVSTLQALTYDHPDWRKRLHFTHWKPLSQDHDGYVFPIEDLHPPVPKGLEWDTVDWSGVREVVEQARTLIEQQFRADRQAIQDVHEQLKVLLEPDDTFYLHQWLYFCRRVKQHDLAEHFFADPLD
jgi:hypothetical protein